MNKEIETFLVFLSIGLFALALFLSFKFGKELAYRFYEHKYQMCIDRK